MTADDRTNLPEKSGYLALMATGPAIWMLHFLLSYVTAAIWCSRHAGPEGAIGPVPTFVMVYTVAALAGILFAGWGAYQRHALGDSSPPHDADSPEDRHRFLGFATMLLAGLSAVATLYSALAVAFFDTCR